MTQQLIILALSAHILSACSNEKNKSHEPSQDASKSAENQYAQEICNCFDIEDKDAFYDCYFPILEDPEFMTSNGDEVMRHLRNICPENADMVRIGTNK